ncbi:MAG TPA: alkene reductase, partial [Acidobacteria bacterium]|nr:alkene reductase [Acidobacteriota bacterium]
MSQTQTLTLLTPAPLGPYSLANRMVMAPMTRSRAAGAGRVPNDLMADYYRQRASAGLILTEATQVSPQGVGYPDTPGIHSDAQVEGWKRITAAVHEKGGRIFLQVFHVGRISHTSLQPEGALPVAPSAIAADGTLFTYEGPQPFGTPRALELEEIPGVVEQFADAARRALAAGFDGIEIHGANGYLIDQFLRDGTNHRTDAYGGSLENRARFLLEVTRAVVAVWGADRVGLRLSPLGSYNSMSDSDPEATFAYAARELGKLKLGFLHAAMLNGAEKPDTREHRMAKLLKESFGGTFIINGGFSRETGEQAVTSGLADFVAYGAPFLANPDLP